MRKAGLEEAEAGIKIARRTINNLTYADDTTVLAESEEELKRLLVKVKRRVKTWPLSHHIMANRWGIVETVSDIILRGPQNHCRW